MALDDLSGLSEEDRSTRKAASERALFVLDGAALGRRTKRGYQIGANHVESRSAPGLVTQKFCRAAFLIPFS